MLIELENDDELFVQSSPELLNTIRREVLMAVRSARANPAPSILSSNTINGGLGCSTAPERPKQEPDALQTFVETHRTEDGDLFGQFRRQQHEQNN